MVPQVVAVGPGREEEDGKSVKPKVEVGATVLYQKYSGTEVRRGRGVGGEGWAAFSSLDGCSEQHRQRLRQWQRAAAAAAAWKGTRGGARRPCA